MKMNHKTYMEKAMRQAMVAFDAGEIPVGCVMSSILKILMLCRW